jgi:U3 small nucleolar RNA-associated protein 25
LQSQEKWLDQWEDLVVDFEVEVEVESVVVAEESRPITRGITSRHPVWKRQGVRAITLPRISLADAYRDTSASSADEDSDLSEDEHHVSEILDEASESDEESSNPASSYGELLRSLNPENRDNIPPTKKRKLLNGSSDFTLSPTKTGQAKEEAPADSLPTNDFNHRAESDGSESDFQDAEDEDNLLLVDQEEDGAGEEEDLTDPLESHFANSDTRFLSEGVKAVKEDRWMLQPIKASQGVKLQNSVPASAHGPALGAPQILPFEGLKLKRRLIASGRKVWSTLGSAEREIAFSVFFYKDVLFGSRTVANAPSLRDLVVLHALNHVLKTRDRVIKNNAKLAQAENQDTPELRDQGFTRPKVLIILPTRQACVKFLDSVVELCEPEQQENKSRFLEGFAQNDNDSWEDKPSDFQELFGGNDDDMFRIGVKFTRKTMKFFSAFYNSDIILASPLGLRTAIESGGSKDGKKGSDADFLSSIEVVIIDHASALLMQNWQHVEYVVSQLNLLPKESHGCDFSRVRHWYLDGEAKYLRQTIVFSDFITPEINSIYTKTMINVAGKFRFSSIYEGAMIDIAASLPVRIPQTFLRLNALTPTSDADVRFTHFTSSVLPSLLKSKQEKGTLIFMSSYLDFVRVRNHFSTSTSTASLSFGAISEYTSVRDVARARSHFLTGRQSILLYSERAHHFRRYKIKGVQRVVFYSLPENPIFWAEVVGMLYPGFADSADKGRRTVKALFSRWDVLKLERVVGTSRVGKMVNEKAGDTFEFT